MAAVIYLASTCSISFPAATPVAVIKTGVFFIFSDFSVISRCCLERHIHVPREPKPQTHPEFPFPSQQHLRLPKLQFLHLFISHASLFNLSAVTKDPSHWYPAEKSFLSNFWYISILNVLLLEVRVCKQAWFIELELIYYTL